MSLSNQDNKFVLEEHLRNISHIADKEYQKKIWIRGEGPEADNFDEAVCYFFDAGDPILEKYKSYDISESQKELLVNLRSAFDAFNDDHLFDFPEKFIDSPEWDRITNMAKEVLNAFDYKE